MQAKINSMIEEFENFLSNAAQEAGNMLKESIDKIKNTTWTERAILAAAIYVIYKIFSKK